MFRDNLSVQFQASESKKNLTFLGCAALSLDGFIPRFLHIVAPSYSRLRNRRRLSDPAVEGITILRNIRKCPASPPRFLVSAATSLGESELSQVRDVSLFKTSCPFVATNVEGNPSSIVTAACRRPLLPASFHCSPSINACTLAETAPVLGRGRFLDLWKDMGLITWKFNPYPTAFPYGNGMVLHFYQQQESSTTKTVHRVINKGLKAYV